MVGARGDRKGEGAAEVEKTIQRTFSHNLCTSDSVSCLQAIRLSIQPSRVGMVVS